VIADLFRWCTHGLEELLLDRPDIRMGLWDGNRILIVVDRTCDDARVKKR
jgi:hypothetical protein